MTLALPASFERNAEFLQKHLRHFDVVIVCTPRQTTIWANARGRAALAVNTSFGSEPFPADWAIPDPALRTRTIQDFGFWPEGWEWITFEPSKKMLEENEWVTNSSTTIDTACDIPEFAWGITSHLAHADRTVRVACHSPTKGLCRAVYKFPDEIGRAPPTGEGQLQIQPLEDNECEAPCVLLNPAYAPPTVPWLSEFKPKPAAAPTPFPTGLPLFELSPEVCDTLSVEDSDQMLSDMVQCDMLRLPYPEIAVRFQLKDLRLGPPDPADDIFSTFTVSEPLQLQDIRGPEPKICGPDMTKAWGKAWEIEQGAFHKACADPAWVQANDRKPRRERGKPWPEQYAAPAWEWTAEKYQKAVARGTRRLMTLMQELGKVGLPRRVPAEFNEAMADIEKLVELRRKLS